MSTTQTIEGEVVLQPPATLADASLVVSLRDTTLADAAAVIIAERRSTISGKPVARVPFQLDVPADLRRDRRYTLGAEIRRSGGDVMAPGDYLNVQAVPWSADSPSAVIPVRPIGASTRKTRGGDP